MRRIRIWAGSLLAAGAILACASAPAGAASTEDLSSVLLDRWTSTQAPAGNYVRPSGSQVTGGYGNGSIAYALLLEAVHSGSDSDFRSAMRAFGYMVNSRIPVQGVFYPLFTAAGFNLAREYFGARPEFQQISAAWVARLKQFKWPKGSEPRRYRDNKDVVLALETVELFRTGVRSKRRGAITRNPKAALRRAVRMLGRHVPRTASAWSAKVGTAQGWRMTVRLADLSDPPQNAPAYDALVAGMYARAIDRLPASRRTARMVKTARYLLRGVVARTAPDGDLAFAGRSQELSWALSFAAYAGWSAASRLPNDQERLTYLEFSRRVMQRLADVHTVGGSFLLTPAQGCCGAVDNPPGQDHYFDVASYSGLTGIALGWSYAVRPADWKTPSWMPSDLPSTYIFSKGRGRFIQRRDASVYWMLRGQSDFADARSDMGVAILKRLRSDGSWVDVIPPRPYSGGHGRKADPAAPCLAIGKRHRKCAYLELRRARKTGDSWRFSARWRIPKGRVVRRSTALVTPTPTGLRLSWGAKAGSVFKIDHFLPQAGCVLGGVAAPGVTIAVTGNAVSCGVVAHGYAGGSRTDLDRVRLTARPRGGFVAVEYSAAG